VTQEAKSQATRNKVCGKL